MTTTVTSTANEEELSCPDCGYDLRGIGGSERCPECGWAIDRAALARSHLPWPFRRDIGRWRAFWRTAELGTFRLKKLAAEVVRPVNEDDARRFATVTALVAGVPLAAGVIIAGYAWGGTNFLNPIETLGRELPAAATPAGLVVPLAAGLTFRPAAPIGIVLLLWMMVRAPVWLFWRSAAHAASPARAERARALSHYGCAPLVLAVTAPIIMGISACARAFDVAGPTVFTADQAGGFAVWGLIIPVAWWWANALRLLRRTLHASGARVLAAAVVLPVLWLVCAAVALGVMPWVVGFAWLFCDSVFGG